MAALWCMHVIGPDDVVPVASYLAAIEASNRFNAWYRDFVDAEIRKTGSFSENWPRTWARPDPWPWDATDHATLVAQPPEQYAPFLASEPAQ